MKQSWIQMEMPITVEIEGAHESSQPFHEVYTYFDHIDNVFSTYKPDSEISLLNNGKLSPEQVSEELKTILELSEQTKEQTNNYFNIDHNGMLDPSGIVKGWAIYHAGELLKKQGYTSFYIDAGGDIQTSGNSGNQEPWKVGIRNPFKRQENIKILSVSGEGVATSGTAIRGQHIYNPHTNQPLTEIVSLTVIASNIYEADRMATAAFAMGNDGIIFLQSIGLEAYQINKEGQATYTSGMEKYFI